MTNSPHPEARLVTSNGDPADLDRPGAGVAGVRTGKGGMRTSDPTPRWIPAGGDGLFVVEFTIVALDRNSIFKRTGPIPAELEISPVVIQPVYSEVTTIDVTNTSLSQIGVSVTVFEGKMYSTKENSEQAGPPPVAKLLSNSQTVNPGDTLSLEWDGLWSDGTVALSGPYVLKFEITQGSNTWTEFRKVMVH